MLDETRRADFVHQLRVGRETELAIPRRSSDYEATPLSCEQEQLWVIDALAPGRSTYNITGTLEIQGPLDVSALERALDKVITRHEILRTHFESRDDGPWQVVDATPATPLTVIDLREHSSSERNAIAQKLTEEEVTTPFDMIHGPLLRLTLLMLAETCSTMVIAVHHAIFDGWSFGVLTEEIVRLYDAELVGATGDLPHLAVQYADYAVWQRERLAGQLGEDLSEFWRDALAGAGDLDMPIDRPRPGVQSYAGDIRKATVGVEVLAGLRALSLKERTTLFVTLLTAFGVVLHRYSGQDDVVIGTVTANRDRPELASLIGYLVNTLPIRADLSGDPTFRTALRRVAAVTIDAYAHQSMPFGRLVDAVGAPRDASKHPIFQVGFTLVEQGVEPISTRTVTVIPRAVQSTAAKFDLTVSAEPGEEGIELVASYATALFDAGTIDHLMNSFRCILSAIVADPDSLLSQLPLLSGEDAQEEVRRWNTNKMDTQPSCIHERFEGIVDRFGDRTAVALDGDVVEYATLNVLANRLARQLRDLGVGPESIVGICMRSSIERIVATLAVLKAGGGYVPLDPDYPADRLGFIVADAATSIVLTDTTSEGAVPDSVAQTVRVDIKALGEGDGSNLPAGAGPDNAAYVIYTSGSTGHPKGVVVEHRQAVNFAYAEIEHWPLTSDDRVLQFASFNFDVSVLDILGALLSGASLILGRTETLQSPPRLTELIRSAGVTFMCMPPAVLGLLDCHDFPALRLVISGGEALPSALARKWCRPGLRFINGYGPTEATVGSTMYECSGSDRDPMPIGLPLANYRAYVLDQHLQPVPRGAIGELFIGGAGVSRGYLNRPELTENHFLPDPYGDGESPRMYRTGDFARRRADGNLLFLGRRDGQVKVRGLRIELGEIESVLTEIPGVVQAVVTVQPDRVDQPAIVGYLRVQDGSIQIDRVQAQLAERLPRYMVPAQLIVLDEFPLTSNGKLDTARLPKPTTQDALPLRKSPRTMVEAVIVDAFAELLGYETVGVDEDFFDLGGNSLQAMRLIARLRTDLAVDADVTAIFLTPTPATLSAMLCTRYGLADQPLEETLEASESAGSGLTRARLIGSNRGPGTAAASSAGELICFGEPSGKPPVFLVHAVGGGAFAYGHLAAGLAATFDVYGLEAPGLRPGTSPAGSLLELIGGHLETIRTVAPVGPYVVGGWSVGGVLALELAGRLESDGGDVAFVVLIDTPVLSGAELTCSDAELAHWFVADAIRVQGGPMPEETEILDTVQASLGWLARHLRTDIAEIERRFAVYRQHMRLLAGHRPAPVRAEVLIAGAEASYDSFADWNPILGDGVRNLRVPGDHYSSLQGAGARALAAAMGALVMVDRVAERTECDGELSSYRLDPELAPWVPLLSPPSLLDVPAARRQQRQMLENGPCMDRPPAVTVADLVVPSDGTNPPVGLRIYRPDHLGRDCPMLLYIHGGGFVIGDLDSVDVPAAQLSLEIDAMVAVVDYRLAPEHPYPAALEDCYHSLRWLSSVAGLLGIDAGRFGLAGDSAGGGLALAVALLTRDSHGPEVQFLYLDCPQLDDRMITPSMEKYVDTPWLTRTEIDASWRHYLGHPLTGRGDEISAHAAPARACDLSKLPPTYIATAQFDPLRDEGIDFAQRLAQAGVPTELHLYPGTFHYSTFVSTAHVSIRMTADKVRALRHGLGVDHPEADPRGSTCRKDRD